MREYRFADKGDIPALHTIWREAFPADADGDIEAFLERVTLPTECLVAAVDGRPVSMVFLLPAVWRCGERKMPLQYIYAAATLKAFRGEGIFGELLNKALQLAEKQGCAASFLRPAQPSLCGYYARFGYRPFFFCQTESGNAANDDVTFRRVDADEYTAARNALLPKAAVEWQQRFVDYASDDGAVVWNEEEHRGCALCKRQGDNLFIQEILCAEKERTRYCEGLAAWFGCETYTCRVSSRSGEVFGMICPLATWETQNEAIPFMGLALD